MDYAKICQQICEIAREVGNFIRQERQTFSYDKVEFKGTQNLVSYVDKEAEQRIVAALAKLIPEAGFVTEEETTAQNREASCKWIIDPLDGTTNFVHGLPPYCVSIALMEGDEVCVGVVYEITQQECFYAWKNAEAYLNGRPIHTAPTTSMRDALIAIGFPYRIENELTAIIENVSYYILNTNGVRRIGSAATDLAYVACGRFDAFSQINLAAWDVAAGAFIVERAGGIVTDFAGGRNFVFGQRILAAAPALFAEFSTIATRNL